MKKYIATFWRGNPQLHNGGYELKMTIEARTEMSAKKKAEKRAENTSYGYMSLTNLEPAI